MFRPTSMRRFYLAVPIEKEEEIIKKLGELGAVQLTRWIRTEITEKSEIVELGRKFMRLYERMNSVLAIEFSKNPAEKYFNETAEVDENQIKSFVNQIETKLDESIGAIENIKTEIKNLKMVQERLELLRDYELRLDEIGNFKHIFVKAGFLSNAQLPKLGAYTGGTSVVYATKPGRTGETFLVVTGLNEDLELTTNTLKLLNFEEFAYPQGLNPEPKVALEEVKNAIEAKKEEAEKLNGELLKIKEKFDYYAPYVSNVLQIEEIKGSITRTKKKSLIHGWIPSNKTEQLRTDLEETVPTENLYLKFENPHPQDEVPVQTKNRGIFRGFEIFTFLQGVPNYFEVNPTPIYTFLYVVMFGMMFGDIGGGAIFVLLGVMLTRMKKGLLVFSQSATRKLGQILISCGFSGVFFGFLYGELFLKEVTHPLLLSPLLDINDIIVIALTFGVAQIILALTLNIINRVRRKESLRAVFSGNGVFGLTLYLSGIIVAIAFIRKMSFNAFLEPSVLPFTLIALVSLAIVFLSPVIESIIKRESAKFLEKIMEGFGEGLKTFIAFIANSVSYIRLAAFAIAHGALGLAAVIFASIVGDVPSLILMNVILFLVGGFAALIQSLRLMYYEFSTKFYEGDGNLYKPFKLSPSKPKV